MLHSKWVYSEVVGIQQYTKIPIVFLYTSNKQPEFEIWNGNIYNTIKIIKLLGVNLTKYVQNSCIKNYNMMLEEINEVLNK